MMKKVDSAFVVYMLECADGTFYIGSTNNLDKRLHQHNYLKSGAHYTKIRRPVQLAYSEQCADYATARSREAALKRMTRNEKQQLIAAAML
jgi:putative endonuclease